MSNKNYGDRGEQIACHHLQLKNYQIIDRNYRTVYGEIDIIAISGNDLIFVEVKTRGNMNFGHAYEAVNYVKQQKIINTALKYIQQYGMHSYQPRFDIIEVYTNLGEINHIENAFT